MGYSEKIKEFTPAANEAQVAAEVVRIKALALRNENAGVWKACLGAIDLTSLGTPIPTAR